MNDSQLTISNSGVARIGIQNVYFIKMLSPCISMMMVIYPNPKNVRLELDTTNCQFGIEVIVILHQYV